MSTFKQQEQLRRYRELMGHEATERQLQAAEAARGGCKCATRVVKRKWNGEFAPATEKVIHEGWCLKFRSWMAEV